MLLMQTYIWQMGLDQTAIPVHFLKHQYTRPFSLVGTTGEGLYICLKNLYWFILAYIKSGDKVFIRQLESIISFTISMIGYHFMCHWNWRSLCRYMEPVISEIPIMVVEGNHEIEQQAENKAFVSYSSRFAFPSEESESFSTFYYSFNAGGIHFIMLGAYISYNKSG